MTSEELPTDNNETLTIVFDLDGTLIDTAPDLVRATNHVLASVDLAPVTMNKLRNWVGFGARRMIVEGLVDGGVELSEQKTDQLLTDFLDYYAAHIALESVPFPGAIAALDRLHSAGHRFAICTNKSEALAKKLMRELKLADRFAAITGRDTFLVNKPDPGHLTGTLEMAGGNPARAFMIGDSITDIKTAKAAGIPVIGVTHGYTDQPIEELGADAVISHFDDLDCAIQGITAIL